MRGKLNLRYIGPYEVIEKLNLITYRLDLLVELKHIHDMFHISQVMKYIPDPDDATEPIEVTKDLVYDERSVQIPDHRIKKLCNKKIPLVKLLLTNHTSSETTWKTDEEMKAKCPYLLEVILHVLTNVISFEDKIL